MPRPFLSPARHLLAAATALAILGCSDTPTGPTQSTLTAGQSVFITGGINSQRLFVLQVPEGTGTLQVLLSGGAGDADLVLRRGAPPEVGLFDCVSETDGNEEECIIDSPQAGSWYVLVNGFDSYSNVRLVANLGAVSGAVVILSGVPVLDLYGGAGAFRMFAINVPAGAVALHVTLDGPNGDADLYLRRGAFPLLNDYDQASFSMGSQESVTQFSPAAGNWYIRVEGYEAYAGATLTATLTAPALRAP